VNNKRRSLAAVAAISLLLAACGDDDTESSGTAATDEAAAEATSPPAATTGGGRGDYGPSETEAAAPATEAPSGDEAAGGAEIVISGFAFSEDITVPVGTTVVVRNDDSAPHTWTADDGAFDSGNIDGGGTFEFTFTEAGTFAFHCNVHPSMTGTITVTG
jgi:plastocyanin